MAREAYRGDIQQQRVFVIRNATATKKEAKVEMMAAVSPMSVMKCHNSNASTNATIQGKLEAIGKTNHLLISTKMYLIEGKGVPPPSSSVD